jgi:hypothetical protein
MHIIVVADTHVVSIDPHAQPLLYDTCHNRASLAPIAAHIRPVIERWFAPIFDAAENDYGCHERTAVSDPFFFRDNIVPLQKLALIAHLILGDPARIDSYPTAVLCFGATVTCARATYAAICETCQPVRAFLAASSSFTLFKP